MAYFPKFRPHEVLVCVRSSEQWSSVPQSVRELGVCSPKSVLSVPYLSKAEALLSLASEISREVAEEMHEPLLRSDVSN